MHLVSFSIVLYRAIVTVYTNNIFLYNSLCKMHQIIHVSLVGCSTPAQGKPVQNNREESVINNCQWCGVIRRSIQSVLHQLKHFAGI